MFRCFMETNEAINCPRTFHPLNSRKHFIYTICIVITAFVYYARPANAAILCTVNVTACWNRFSFVSFVACCKFFPCCGGLDVSEESEYELWSDRFGSWIGRSSKSRSPDSLKHLRYDRKSSSQYSLLFVAVFHVFVYFYARPPHAIVCHLKCFLLHA